MKLLVLSDFHGVGVLPEENPDVVVLLGDIEYAEIRKIDARYTCPKIGVLGNHDGPDYLVGTNIINLHERTVEIGGLTFAGFEGCPRYNRRNYLQYWEDEVASFTDALPTVDVFIAHSNPAVDTVYDETDPHRGFRAFTTYIQEKKPTYFIHGHVHTDKQYTMGETSVLSVYPHAVLVL